MYENSRGKSELRVREFYSRKDAQKRDDDWYSREIWNKYIRHHLMGWDDISPLHVSTHTPPQDIGKILVDSNGPKVEKQTFTTRLYVISLHATTQK